MRKLDNIWHLEENEDITYIFEQLIKREVLSLGLPEPEYHPISSNIELERLIEQNTRPDLLISSMSKSPITRLQILQKVRNRYHAKILPIIIFTGGLDSDFLEGARNLGNIYYLQKPADKTVLKRIIKEICLSMD